MKLRRIAYVLNIFPKLSETFIANELAELQKRGVELKILSLLPPRDKIQHPIISRCGLDRLVEYRVSEFAATVKRFRPNVLHAHFAREATEKARELSAACNVPFTFTAHGYDIYRKPPSDLNQRASAALAVVTVSRANARYLHETFDIPESRIKIIASGVDVNLFSPPGNDFRKPDPPLIVCVARLVPVKNLALLVEACALLRDRGIDFRGVIIGDGPCRAELEERIAQRKLKGLLELAGAADQETVLGYWKKAAVGVLTSSSEGMPVSLMEAGACGVPVVATRVGGIPELVLDGQSGFLTGSGDAVAFAGALERLLAQASLRRELGVNGRARIEELFSVSRQAESLLNFWTETLSACPV